jgi:DNA-damage-inducible protein D
MTNSLAIFEGYKIRRHYDENTETWYLSVVDIIQVLIQQPDYQAARNYWKVLKNRLKKEASESVAKCNRLKMEAADGKKYLTDVANPETILRLIQSVPSSKAELIKLWLAKVGYERMQDMSDPAHSLEKTGESNGDELSPVENELVTKCNRLQKNRNSARFKREEKRDVIAEFGMRIVE